MTEDALKRGFHYSEGNNPWTCEDWLYQADKSDQDKAVFYGYDANLFPMPDFSRFSPSHRKNVTAKALEWIESTGFTGEVWFDDVCIRQKLQS